MPFIEAINSGSNDIIKLFIEIKVDINFEEVFTHFNEIAKNNPRFIFLLINETKTEFKNQIIRESFKAVLSTNNVEILKFLLNEKYEFENLLIKAAECSNLEIILEFNHSVEFINKIGKFGTALFEAVRSTGIKQRRNLDYTWQNREYVIEQFLKSRNEIIEYLLKQEGTDPSFSVNLIGTPLIEAIKENNDMTIIILNIKENKFMKYSK